MRMGWVVVVVVAAVGACGGDEDDGGAYATIWVQDLDGIGGGVIGSFSDRALPAYLPAPEDGSCVVHPRPNPSCDPACSDGQVCALDGSCVEPANSISAGQLTMRIDGGVDIAVDEFVTGSYDLHQQNDLLGNAHHVDVAASGSDQMAAFDVGLDVPVGNFLLLAEAPAPVAGEDLALSWSGADPASQVRITLLDRLGAQIWCEVADTGSFAVPADVVTEFLDIASWTGEEARSVVERYRESEFPVDGGARVRLHIGRGAIFLLPAPG